MPADSELHNPPLKLD